MNTPYSKNNGRKLNPNCVNRWRAEFPHIFRKNLYIKLDRINVRSNNEIEDRISDEMIDDDKFLRVTRSKNKENTKIDWVRILNGEYKGDIAKVDIFDEKNGLVHCKLFPRINYDLNDDGIGNKPSNKRRYMSKAFDPNEIRYFVWIFVINENTYF